MENWMESNKTKIQSKILSFPCINFGERNRNEERIWEHEYFDFRYVDVEMNKGYPCDNLQHAEKQGRRKEGTWFKGESETVDFVHRSNNRIC